MSRAKYEKKRVPAEVFSDRRLDPIITPEQAETLFASCLLCVAARRGVPPDVKVPSQHTEALQRLYRCGYERGKKEALAALADDGK